MKFNRLPKRTALSRDMNNHESHMVKVLNKRRAKEKRAKEARKVNR